MNEIISLEINQIELINQIDNLISSIEDFKAVYVLIFAFIIGYMIIRDFINNIFNSI